MEAAPHPWPALGALLLRDGLVTREDLDDVLSQQEDSSRNRISGNRLGEALVERGLVSAEQVARLVAEQYELPYVELEPADVTLQVAALLPEELCERLAALPVTALPDDSVLVAVADPANVLHSDELRRVVARPLRFAVSTPDTLRATIAHVQNSLRQTSTGRGPAADVVTLEPSDTDEPATSAPRSFLEVVEDAPPRAALGALLVRQRLVTEEELDATLAQQRLTGSKRLGEILVERGVVTRTQVARLVAEQYELPFLDLADLGVDPQAGVLLPELAARRLCALPVSFTSDGSLIVAVGDPTDAFYADDLRLELDVPLRFAVADPDEIEAEISRLYAPAPAEAEVRSDVPVAEDEPARDDVGLGFAEPVLTMVPDDEQAAREDEEPFVESEPAVEYEDDPPAELEALEELPEEPGGEDEPEPQHEDEPAEEVSTPVASAPAAEVDTTALEETIERALALGATDIHFAPKPETIAVRVRIDGVLRELETFPGARQPELAAGLKQLAEARHDPSLPFEGRIVFTRDDATTDLRLVVLPTVHGEKSTLHVLSAFSQVVSLADLDLGSDHEDAFRAVLTHPSGLVLVGGRDGSGCSTTLYAALRELNTAERALATIEGPIRQVVPGVDQVEVDESHGLTSAAGLRAILLSDPDVVLVGEVTDSETAAAAVRAAVSGRLVLSRVRVGSLVDVLERLSELGVDRGTVAATLRAVLVQRLVQRICEDCREPYYASEAELAVLERPREEAGRRLLARGSGCVACAGTGFRGQVAIFELLSVTDEIRELLAGGAAAGEIEHAAVSSGMRTFRSEGIRLCLEGLTSVSELQRLTSGEPEPETATVDEAPAIWGSDEGAAALD
jgi:type IV pilus assembly protein PilB